MSNCNYRAPNGEPSLLYSNLMAKYGDQKAEQLWYEAKSEQFKTRFEGQEIPRDTNGEPTADWISSVLVNASLPGASDPKPVEVTVTTERFLKNLNSETDITTRVKQFYDAATGTPGVTYTVPFKRNTPGIKLIGNRISMTRLAELFQQFPIPENVRFDDTFQGLMSTTPTRILNNTIITPITLIPVDEKEIQQSKDNNFLKMRDEYGNATGGYFSYEKQQEAIDSIVYLVYSRFMKGMTKASDVKNAVEQVLKAALTRHLDIVAGKKFAGFEDVTKQMAENRAKDLQDILNVFHVKGQNNTLWNFTLERLKLYGLNLYGYESTEDPTQLKQLTDGSQELIQQQDGTYIRDYRDSSFELDRKDTASSRIKLFLSSIEDSEDKRTIRLSFSSALTREDILSGKKNTTIRTADVGKELGLNQGESAITRIDGRAVKVTSLGPISESQLDVYADTAASEGISLKPGMIAYSLAPVKDESTLAIQKNYLGMPKLINFEDTFQKLMATLADQEPSLSNYMSILYQSPDPVIRRVAEKLDRESPEVKNEFVSVMSNQYQQFSVVMFGKKLLQSGMTHIQSRTFMANYSSQLNVLQRNWEQLQKTAPITQRDSAGNIIINQALATEFAGRLIQVNDSGSYDSAGMDLFKDLMKANGIDLTDEFYTNFVKNTATFTKGTRLQGNFERQFQFNKDGSPAGIISTLIGRLSGSFISGSDEEVENSFQVNNPMYTEGTAMNILARAALQYTPMVYSNSHRSSEGKSIYDHGLNTSLSHKVRKLKADADYRKQKGSTYINEHNMLLGALHNDPELRDRFQLTYMDGLKPEYLKGSSGTSRSDMSMREQLLYSLALFEKRGSNKYADYISLTHSDKTTTPIFLNGPRIPLVTSQKIVEGPMGQQRMQVISDDTYRAMYAVFEDEYNRIVKTASTSYNSDQFDKGKNFFFSMPEFNLDNMKKAVQRGTITKEEFNALWTDLGAIKPINTKEARQVLLKMFNARIEKMTNRTLESWTKEGLLSDNMVPFSLKYTSRLLGGIGIFSMEMAPGQWSYQTSDGQTLTDKEAAEVAATLAARDYAVNHFIFNVSASRLLYGDPAEVFKTDHAATMVEYAKRLAKDIAPGKDGQWDHSPKYTSITVEDWEGPATEVQELISAYGEKVNATDAQELITTQEYLDGKYAVGQIAEKTYREMSAIIKEGLNNNGYYEFTKPEHKLAMVPQKPVYVGEEGLNNGVILTHYIKSSAYPLLPQFTIGKELDALRLNMETTGIARVNFKSAAKMGRPAAKLKLFKKDGSMDLSVFKSPAFTGKDENGNPVPSVRQTLDRSGFRIQQEIPHDADKKKIGIVTQMNTLIVQGIATIKEPFIYQGQQVTAQALMDAKTQIRQRIFGMKSAEIMSDIGMTIGEEKNFNKLYDRLHEEATSRPGYSLNDLELLMYRNEDGTPKMPMIFSPSRSRFESLLMNTISQMTDMKMYGHSFVQASSAGLKQLRTDGFTTEEKKHIVFAGDYRGGELKTLRHENGEVKPAQVLVPWHFVGKGMDMKKFITTTEDGHQVIDMEKLPPEFLQLIGARIPNQGHSSMLPIEVVGFLPEEMADTIFVPAAITKQMGSDFDVDKLYTYQRPYNFQEGKVSTPSELEDQLLNSYFDIHWSILMHPEMTERILSPLDKPDLKMEADKVPIPEGSDYFDVIEQLESFQSNKFAKQLVGFGALSLTNNAVFEPLNIPLGKRQWNDELNDTETVPYSLRFVTENGIVHELSQLSGYGVSTNTDLAEDNTRTKADNIIIMLSGFLDHAKDPVTPQINLNLYTYNAASAFLRLQTADDIAMGIPELAGLLRQPVILEYSQMMSAGNDSLSTTVEPDLHKKVMETLGRKYSELAGVEGSPGPAEINLTDLRDDWKQKEGKPYAERQLRVLHLFDILWKMGKQIADIQSGYSWDVAGAGPSVLQAISKQNIIGDTQVMNAMPDAIVIQNLESINDTEKGYIRNQLMGAIYRVALDVFPYDKLEPVMDKYKEITGNGFISPKTQTALIEGYLAHQWTNAPIWGDDTRMQSDRVRLMYTGQHGQSLAKRVQDAKISWGRTNYLLQRLESNLATTGPGPDFVSYSLGISSGFDAAEIARSWINMLTSTDENQRRLGEDLVRYAIMTGNTSTLARHIPISYLLGTSFLQATAAMDQRLNDDEQEVVSELFMRQFLQHYPQYTKQLSVDFKETGNTYEDFPESFKMLPINLEDQNHPGRPLWIIQGEDYSYPRYLAYRNTATNKWLLYEQQNYLTYNRIDTLGNNQIDEYSPVKATSIFPENKAYERKAEVNQDPQKGVRHMWGMPATGGWTEFSETLEKIGNMLTEPTLYRQMADILNAMQPTLEKSIVESLTGQPVKPFTFEFANLEGVDGRMDSLDNKIWISNGVAFTNFSKTLIHETIHHHTASVVTMMDIEENPEYYEKLVKDGKLSQESLEKLKRASREMKANMPAIHERVHALNQIRQQALDQYRKEGKTNRVLEYALSSNAEFLAHIFTDADVMRWLNNRKADVQKSFFDTVADIISQIMKSIADFIGVGVQEGSLLEEGVKRSMDLMMMDKAIQTMTTKGILDVNPDIFKNSAIAAKAPLAGEPLMKVNRIIARLEDQRREIKQTFTGTITPDQAARKRKMLDDLDKEIAKLKDEQDLKLIAQVGKQQLSWVTEIMKRKDKAANDIITADRILELWTNLIDVMYGEGNLARVDPEWKQIASDAQEYRRQLTGMAIDSMIQQSGGQLSKRDFSSKELEDTSWTQTRLRGLSSAAKSKALQYVSTYMETVGRNVNEDVLRTLKETAQLEKDFLAYAGSKDALKGVYQKLMQENDSGTAWGLVRRYSPAWYGYLTDMKTKREHRIDVINRDKGTSGLQKAALKKIAWQDFWTSMNNNAAFVDTRLFFTETGEDHPNMQKAYDELVKEVGEDQAKASIKKARERYEKYLEEKEIITNHMQADVLTGEKTQEQADKEVQAWIGRYSPNVFFNNFKNNFAVFNENNTDRFVIMIPKAKHTKYFDKKFTTLQQDEKLYALYNRLHGTLMKLRSFLPKTLQYDLGENFLPVVANNLLSDISSVPEYIKGMPQRFLDSLTASNWEQDNKGSERIPINYVNTNPVKDPIEIAGRSKDLVKITELFAAMAIHYKHFANAKDVIDMGQSIIREIDRTRTKDGKIIDEQGRVLQAPAALTNALEGLQYMKEYVMFKRAKALEGNTGVKVYSTNPVTNAKIASRVKELVIKKEQLNEKLLNGDIDGEEWKSQTKEIDDELTKYDGRPVYGSKVGDKLISIAQAKALSFNPFSAVANFAFGVVSSAIFANGRQEFGNGDFMQAMRVMMSSTGKWASFGTAIPELARKVMNVMDTLGVMGDVVESQYGKLEHRERMPKWKKTINPYNWMRSGDYFCRGLNTVATLIKQKVKVTENGVEKEISLWEALDSNGYWNEAKYGKRPEWYSENVEDQTEWHKVKNKVARVNMIIMGNVDKVSPKMANKWIIGRLLGQFRLSWLPEGWYNRFAEEKYDIQLQRTTKGRFTTFKDLGIGGSLRVLLKQYASVVSKVDPFTGEHKMNGQKIGEVDIENMRRNFAEINFYLMIVGAVMMLRSLGGLGDDDDESQSMQLLINMMLRMKQDVAFYSSPSVFDAVTRNAVPSFGVIKDYTKLMDASWKIMTEDDYTADRWLLKLTHAGLPIPQATLYNKIKYMSERDLDTISQ